MISQEAVRKVSSPPSYSCSAYMRLWIRSSGLAPGCSPCLCLSQVRTGNMEQLFFRESYPCCTGTSET